MARLSTYHIMLVDSSQKPQIGTSSEPLQALVGYEYICSGVAHTDLKLPNSALGNVHR